MQKADIRAVENPISATFDLAADVHDKAPKVRRLVTYSRAFIYLWLFIDFIVIVAISGHPFAAFFLMIVVSLTLYSLRWARDSQSRVTLLVVAGVMSAFVMLFGGLLLLLAILLGILYYLGWIILDMLRDLRKFFDYYAVRHGVILAVRSADPAVRIPEGPDPVTRLLAHIRKASPETEHVMSRPESTKFNVSIRGAGGITHNFDAMVLAEPSSLWSLVGWAYPGWCILVKKYDAPPRLDELKYLKHAAEDVAAARKVPPTRVIALYPVRGGTTVAEDAYQFVTTEVVTLKHRGDVFNCSLELIGEDEDGTYDLVPFIVQSPPRW